MARMFCLPRDRVNAFKQGIKSGEINPDKLSKMTSKERNEVFTKFVGKDAAKMVNAEFESKLLLKNQQAGFLSWAKNVTGIKPLIRQDLIQRINNLERVLDPADKAAFFEDLASARLKADVTVIEANRIAELSRSVQDAKQYMNIETYTFPNEAKRLAYGRTVVKLEDYVSDLKNATNRTTLVDIKRNPLQSIGKGIVNLGGLTKSLTASLDNSVIGRQGLKVLLTHPKIWAKNSALTFIDYARTLKNKDLVMAEVRAEIGSRPNALSGLYRRERLALTNTEEAFPTSLPEKIPLLGRFFKGSETAFTAFQYRTRADLMDLFVKVAEKTGGDIKGMGLVANSLTGRGALGRLEPVADILNNLMFSPRFLKSNIDGLTGQLFDYKNLGNMARKEAALNSIKIILGIATVLGTVKAFNPDAVDLDPRSTDFGKIKIGNTRFDVAGGMSGLVVLAVRMLGGETKSSTSDKITKLGELDAKGKLVFGGRTTLDVFSDFLLNKASPATGVVINVMRGSNAVGDTVTVTTELIKVLVPISIQNAGQIAQDSGSAPLLLAIIADALGIGTNNIPVANIKSGVIPENKNIKNDDLIGVIGLYAKAIGTDPETAFNRIFTGQKIRRVDSGTIIVERMSLEDSTAVKKKGGGNNPTMKLDHTVPLQLGGSNDSSNLKLVTTSEWSSYTKVENALGKALRDGNISKDEAQAQIRSFKDGKIKADDLLNKYK